MFAIILKIMSAGSIFCGALLWLAAILNLMEYWHNKMCKEVVTAECVEKYNESAKPGFTNHYKFEYNWNGTHYKSPWITSQRYITQGQTCEYMINASHPGKYGFLKGDFTFTTETSIICFIIGLVMIALPITM